MILHCITWSIALGLVYTRWITEEEKQDCSCYHNFKDVDNHFGSPAVLVNGKNVVPKLKLIKHILVHTTFSDVVITVFYMVMRDGSQSTRTDVTIKLYHDQ